MFRLGSTTLKHSCCSLAVWRTCCWPAHWPVERAQTVLFVDLLLIFVIAEQQPDVHVGDDLGQCTGWPWHCSTIQPCCAARCRPSRWSQLVGQLGVAGELVVDKLQQPAEQGELLVDKLQQPAEQGELLVDKLLQPAEQGELRAGAAR